MRNRANACATRVPSGTGDRRRGRKQSKWWWETTRNRAFLLATCAFVLTLIVFYASRMASPGTVALVTDDDLALLSGAVEGLHERRTISGFNDLAEASTHVGCTAELMLEQIVAADDADATVEAGRQQGGREGKTTAHLRQYEAHLKHRLNPVLSRAADVAYDTLKQMLWLRSPYVLPKATGSLPRTVFSWLASTVHLHSVVLVEYALWQDDTTSHATALIRSVNLLSWSAAYPRLFNWSRTPCRKSITGTTAQWLRFCETSLSSHEATLTRRAASLEELIVLYPTYAPFRLHHTVLLVVRDNAVATSTSALRLIRGQETKLSTYDHVDPLHRAILTLLEVFATPLEQVSQEKREEVRGLLLTTTLSSCEAFVGATGEDRFWPTPFEKELRPALFDLQQVQLLFAKLRLLLGAELPKNPLTGSCLDA